MRGGRPRENSSTGCEMSTQSFWGQFQVGCTPIGSRLHIRGSRGACPASACLSGSHVPDVLTAPRQRSTRSRRSALVGLGIEHAPPPASGEAEREAAATQQHDLDLTRASASSRASARPRRDRRRRGRRSRRGPRTPATRRASGAGAASVRRRPPRPPAARGRPRVEGQLAALQARVRRRSQQGLARRFSTAWSSTRRTGERAAAARRCRRPGGNARAKRGGG